MKLPQPKVLPGDRVTVLNYRIKGCEAWEHGEVSRSRLDISASHDFKTMYVKWLYDVILERKSRSNFSYGQERGMNTLRIKVGDDEVRRSGI